MRAFIAAVRWVLLFAVIAVAAVVIPLAFIHYAGNALRVAMGMDAL